MCTVSWLFTSDGYELFCNRDERRARKGAHAPTVRLTRGVRFVAPTDGEAGGTWIGANEFGLSLCLLNSYAGAEAPAVLTLKSRGLLLPDLLSRHDTAEVVRAVSRYDLSQFQPFTLLALAPADAPVVLSWTGRRLLVSDDECDSLLPLTSSSYANAEAARARRELLKRMFGSSVSPAADLHIRFHRSHSPAPGPLSVCMHRPDAATVSFSRVKVTLRSIEFYYQPGPPCAAAQGVSVSMPHARGRNDVGGNKPRHCALTNLDA
jgi:hypothetical protein